ncbi:unnamed protein product [Protopolystoma xenopodis]|uniref:Uncharacterized protein n=1 Tax=Protopolystoma xenopodis TaxID=117903 RepID=A0A3S4ZCG5_9PLAT|nr:unnamed protein product [Protopolystoma xenopodis]
MLSFSRPSLRPSANNAIAHRARLVISCRAFHLLPWLLFLSLISHSRIVFSLAEPGLVTSVCCRLLSQLSTPASRLHCLINPVDPPHFPAPTAAAPRSFL